MKHQQNQIDRILSIMESTDKTLIMEASPYAEGYQLVKQMFSGSRNFADDFGRYLRPGANETLERIERKAVRDLDGKISGVTKREWNKLLSQMDFDGALTHAFRENLLGNVSQGQRSIIDDLLEIQRNQGGSLSEEAIEEATADYIDFLNRIKIFREDDELFGIARKAFDDEIDEKIIRGGGELEEVSVEALSNETKREALDAIFRTPISEVSTLSSRQVEYLNSLGIKGWVDRHVGWFSDSEGILKNIQELISTLEKNPDMPVRQRDEIYKAIDKELEKLAKKQVGLERELDDWLTRNLDMKNASQKSIYNSFTKSKDKIAWGRTIWEKLGLKQAYDSYQSYTVRIYKNLKGLFNKQSVVKSTTDVVLGGAGKDYEGWRKVMNILFGTRRLPKEYRQLAKDIGVPAAIISYATEAVLLRSMEIAVIIGTLTFFKNVVGSMMENPPPFWQGWIDPEGSSSWDTTKNAFVNFLTPVYEAFKLTGIPGLGDDIFRLIQWIGSQKSGDTGVLQQTQGFIDDNQSKLDSLQAQAQQNQETFGTMTIDDVKTSIEQQFKDYSQELYNQNKDLIDGIRDSVKEQDGLFTFKYDGVEYDIVKDNDLIKYRVPELQGEKKNIVYFLVGEDSSIKESKKVKGLASLLIKEQQEEITTVSTEEKTPLEIIKKYQDTFIFKDEEGNELKVNIGDPRVLSLWDDVKKMKDRRGEFFQDDDAFVRAVVMYFIDNDKPIYSISYRPTSDIDIALDENKKVIGLAILLEQTYEKTIYVDRIPGSGNFKLQANPGRKSEDNEPAYNTDNIELDSVDIVAQKPEKKDLKVDIRAKQLEKKALAIENSQGVLSDQLDQLIILATTPDKFGYPNLGPCKSLFRFYYKLAAKKTKSELISDEQLDRAVKAMSECQDRYKNITPKIVEYLSNTIADGSEYNQFRYKINFARNDRPIKTWRGGSMNKPN